MEDTDAGLVRACARGEQEALRELYRRYARAVYSWCRKTLASDRLASDATERVFLELWRRARDRDERAPVPAWLFSIARHATGDTAPDPDIYAFWVGGQAAALLDTLPPPQGEVLRLMAYDGRTVEEVSDILGVDGAAVRRAAFEGLAALAGALNPQRAGDGEEP